VIPWKKVVSDQQHRALFRDVPEPPHLGTEVEARQHPQPGEALTDVVGVALVQVRARDPALPSVRHRRGEAAGERAQPMRHAAPRVGGPGQFAAGP
jgi:hypothetical protein